MLKRDQRPSSGRTGDWLTLGAIFVIFIIIILAFISVSHGRSSYCNVNESSASCVREWLVAAAPFLTLFVALYAVGPVVKQWEEMRRQNLLSYANSIQLQMENYEIFRRSIIEIMLLYSDLKYNITADIGQNRFREPIFSCLNHISMEDKRKKIVIDIRLKLTFLKLSSGRNANLSDFTVASSVTQFFSLVERLNFNEKPPVRAEQRIAFFESLLNSPLKTWSDAVVLIDSATDALMRFNEGITLDIGEAESEMKRASDLAKPDI